MTRAGSGRVAAPPGRPGGEHRAAADPARKPLAGASAVVVRDQLSPANVRAFAASSPGWLIAVGLLLMLLCGAAAVVTASTVGERQEALDILLVDTEPNAHSAHRLYTSLSIADAAASTAFIAGGLEPQAVRDRYTQAVGEAAAELVIGSGGHDADTRLRTGIATGLPVYTGLIETARTNNRSGYPVGAAYLSEASHQMQATLLPMAEELEDHRAAAVEAAGRHHVRPPWPAIGLLLLALAALVWVQAMLARRWRRTLNAGLLSASAAVLVLLAWTVLAGSISALAMIDGRDEGAVPGSRLTESRILTQQARSAEMLKLVRRDASGDYDRVYDEGIARLADLLDGYPAEAPATDRLAEARAALDHWRAAHQRMNEALANGDYTGAAAVATGPGAQESAAAVAALDRALDSGLAETRNALRGEISRAARALDFLAPGALVLGMMAIGCVGVGIWPRLREYR
ncbi:hypothetical protein [Nocardia farcinica]|uniref:hypothetical protein n=1 Tax=Nocardia farcinica TaxID=37329 RepID=UPI00189573B5|nr:hypothetical protein [Nocardia farcinica]MBF6292549.1 hypothetical protein [Nocardia farcinica]MBF6379395.1 hypothetical protein [Nocardia farcinica]